MTTYSLVISDANLLVASAGKTVLCSPGYALLDEDKVLVGEDALKQSRLHPRKIHNSFWHRLNTDPLNYPTSRYRHHADLVYAHLKYLAEQLEPDAQVVLAVPGSYSKAQLSLLLGVAQQSPMRVVGLVDAAVASASVYPLQDPCCYLDISLHQGLLTGLEVTHQVKRSSVTAIAGTGLARLYDRWVQLVADVFVEQCRFDPLHSAATEQALYQQLPQWLAAVRSHDEILLEMVAGKKRFEARLSQTQVVERAQPHYAALQNAVTEHLQGRQAQLLVSARLAELPGIEQYLSSFQTTDELAYCRGCEQHLERIYGTGESLRFITALPCLTASPEEMPDARTEESASGPQAPTHLLLGSQAYLLDQPLVIGLSAANEVMVARAPDSVTKAAGSLRPLAQGVTLCADGERVGLSLNGVRITRDCQLQPGDRLSVGESPDELRLISEV